MNDKYTNHDLVFFTSSFGLYVAATNVCKRLEVGIHKAKLA